MTWTDLQRIYRGWNIDYVQKIEDKLGVEPPRVTIGLTREPAPFWWLTWPFVIQQEWGTIHEFKGDSFEGKQTITIKLEKKP